ncbi:uncharacterized protein RCC_03730 [Ramularia collo-cygni]|uniref:RING-type domain-containing protein n=1 Tax=Ramularia collo-cygni TaxID=112498 RepID=A0A2D3VBN9_9PEZI|nr:uncharacterized protein RCC_03730 [Ramularia collo-cygni]CZT17893.1 uncharacterized protein RCC_03730 [Ramularia collo-cygni]
MSTVGPSRKRRRVSPGDDVPIEGTLESETMASAAQTASRQAAEPIEKEENHHKKPCHHEQELLSLHNDLSSMRHLITCNICQRFMYEPYALPCGHTYCYSCLAEWMGTNHKKTCPDCRTYTKQEPTPAFIIKEMVLIFVNRTQLLADGETSEEHHQLAREEADIVAKDRADTDERQGGLFKGTFSRASARPVTAVHDTSDHVDRCPNCLHEVEDGWCLTCHVRVRSSDSDSDDTDSSDMSGEDHIGLDVHHHITISDISSDDGSDSEDAEDLSGFVENDIRWESDADQPDYSFEAVDFEDTPQPQGQAPLLVSDESDSESDSDDMQPIRRRRPVTIDSDSEDDSDEVEDPPVRPNGMRSRGVNRTDVETSSSRRSDSEDTTRHDANAGFSPLQYDSDESNDTTRPVANYHASSRIHVESSSDEESDQASESNVDEESDRSTNGESASDDDEAGQTDDMEMGMGEPGSEEDSDGSEQSTATGYSD